MVLTVFVPTGTDGPGVVTGIEIVVGNICSAVMDILACLLAGFTHTECGMVSAD